MSKPLEELAAILRRSEVSLENSTETFWRIIYWAGGDGVTDEDIRSLPEHWKKRIAEEMSERPSTRQAHPNYFRPAVRGEWTEAAMDEVRLRRDRAFALLERVLLH